MSVDRPPQRDQLPERDDEGDLVPGSPPELSGYLDGELNEAEAAQLAERLAFSEELRDEASALRALDALAQGFAAPPVEEAEWSATFEAAWARAEADEDDDAAFAIAEAREPAKGTTEDDALSALARRFSAPPPVSDVEWSGRWGEVEAQTVDAARSEALFAFAREVASPPPVSADEWAACWTGIERRAGIGAAPEGEVIDASHRFGLGPIASRLLVAAAAVIVVATAVVPALRAPEARSTAVAASQVTRRAASLAERIFHDAPDMIAFNSAPGANEIYIDELWTDLDGSPSVVYPEDSGGPVVIAF